MKNIKANKGITLIALVVTIIVLLILAAVTINLVLGQNGIIGRANQAKSATDIASGKDQVQLALAKVVSDKLEAGKATSDIKAEDLQTELQKTDSSASVTGTNPNFTAKYHVNGTEYEYGINTNTQAVTEILTGNEEIVEPIENVPENWVNITKTAWGYSYKDMSSSEKTEVAVNEPSLTSEMTPIKYVAGSTTGLEEGSKWANAMTPDGSMWVWIPRYAYKITSGEHGEGLTYSSDNITTEAGTIDVIFLKGKTNKDFNGNDVTANGYIVHPAFTFNKNAGGGFGGQSGEDDGIEGIWVAKFEASSVEGNSTANNVTTKTLQVKPNVSSWIDIQIGNMWTVARNAAYGTTQTKDSLHSHMMKNSEWGATAYLAHSKYGRNGTEISINNSSDYYTGRSAGAPGTSSTSTSSAGTYEYNTTGGVLASTTGNVYGIYDMSGGAWEYVASYVNNGDSNISTYGSSFTTTGISSEYVTVYSKGTSGDSQSGNYEASAGMKGDAVYETSKTSTSSVYQTSWFSDYSYFPSSSLPFFNRVGYLSGGADAGAFSFGRNYGCDYSHVGFRPVLAVF